MFDVYGEKVKVLPLGRLFGALILGRQAYHDEQDLFLACDDCNVDLAATVCELDKEGLLESIDGGYPDILYIHNMELSSDIIDAPNVAKFFECLPRIVFQYTNIYPEVIAYAIASADGFYDSQAQTTDFDKRSVDGYSPLLYTENGFRLSESGNLLFCQTE